MFQNDVYENDVYLRDYFQEQGEIPLYALASPPERHSDSRADGTAMLEYYGKVSKSVSTAGVLETLERDHVKRIKRLESMSETAHKTIWYPFTQQKLLTPERISTIDSAYGDHFQVLKAIPDAPGNESSHPEGKNALLEPAFDGSASWWTQGLGHGNPRLALAAAYAAGRYGHVMFAEAIHEPALALSETILKGMNSPRLTRVFFTDNGSTGCEVAVKMALRASRKRYGWAATEKMEILGLKGSYHGDTIGTMDCSEPSVFNEKVEWYQGKGFWLDFPMVWLRNGRWTVDIPAPLHESLGTNLELDSLSDVFDLGAREAQGTYKAYKEYLREVLTHLKSQGRKFGALMLEPIVLGAGGMMLVDPLYQKALVDVVRESPHLFGPPAEPSDTPEGPSWSGLPVIFDEVFTGLYRLGRFTSSSFLNTHADISVHAKLLTGGLVPLCVTLASESVFDAFSSDEKSDALLHGHSYTAHAVGCQVAVESLKELQKMEQRGDWAWCQDAPLENQQTALGSDTGKPWSIWSSSFLDDLSRRSDRVTGVWALGSVLTISMRGEDGVGYNSKAAAKLQSQLRQGIDGAGTVHSRVLGNVLYLMASQKTEKATVDSLQARLETLLT
ncbi:aminotransferase class-III domain-containing protein [Sarocladium implicatum]|nr:aminotransferase class-III domain-containing protein [Sarocladium implicatum]